MTTDELKQDVIVLAEKTAELARALSDVAPSLLAVRLALKDLNPSAFEFAYTEKMTGPALETVKLGLSLQARSLQDLANKLKTSA